MTKKPSPKKPAPKSAKGTVKPKTTRGRKQTKKTQTTIIAEEKAAHYALDTMRKQLKKLVDKLHEEKDVIPHLSDTTRVQLKKLGDKLHEASDKGVHVAKEIAEKIRLFANETTEITKIKIELHSLKKQRENLLLLMGEQLRNLYKSHQLTHIQTKFTYDFKKLDELEATIAEKEKGIKKTSSNLKTIK
ncbi:MAG: hypothetical protein KAI96_05815 [Thermodesulfovibrionia bacterium]|nr:hypothetical protein [Thermodesulfovibrionia bacterium]